ncbi:response regulator transcription factor [Flavobacterium sp. MAH-1]|uniref:Response regulator transcription factor n=1 Tax=Flavobacterium agri TaxID=2743471 RepID=A0A7Y8XZ11_9FLAO|nr:LytTR family DNA-binding domain-containing protein [Flavobacterium agri]NUY79539.1 response regulator transcription factor [Flavobacterium agri]NYA69564.1 response regulator transcription factor [Flavobacterium agri]
MNIVIIEDEPKTAKSLENLILDLKPEAEIIGWYDSVESSVAALSKAQPDLIFMDIQLADGLCFEIFKSVTISCPVIFCTAFDQYSIEAFKSNGVDYILKPFSRDDIWEALKKVDELKNFFQKNATPDLNDLLNKLNPSAGKTSFLVYKNLKYTTVQTDDVAFFYIKNDSTFLVTFDRQEFPLTQTLTQVASLVSAKQFFRVNRQYLVNFKAVKEIEHYFLRKLYIRLAVETPDKLFINKEKSHAFFSWLEDR